MKSRKGHKKSYSLKTWGLEGRRYFQKKTCKNEKQDWRYLQLEMDYAA